MCSGGDGFRMSLRGFGADTLPARSACLTQVTFRSRMPFSSASRLPPHATGHAQLDFPYTSGLRGRGLEPLASPGLCRCSYPLAPTPATGRGKP